jgi:hypothetical protein
MISAVHGQLVFLFIIIYFPMTLDEVSRFSDNLCSRREVSCFVDGCQLVTKHVIVMISFIRKPRRREGRSEVDDIISPSMSTPNLKQAHGSTSSGAPCNSLGSNA